MFILCTPPLFPKPNLNRIDPVGESFLSPFGERVEPVKPGSQVLASSSKVALKVTYTRSDIMNLFIV
jgi:hypothetical protein